MPKQILIVDDDRNIVRCLSLALSEQGYESALAYDGSEGLRKVKLAKPDLIILDVMMPKKSGLALLIELKRDEQYQDIPVLMLSGVEEVLDSLESHEDETFENPSESLREGLRKKIQELRQEGLVRPEMFVDKPVDPETVIAKVKQLIGI